MSGRQAATCRPCETGSLCTDGGRGGGGGSPVTCAPAGPPCPTDSVTLLLASGDHLCSGHGPPGLQLGVSGEGQDRGHMCLPGVSLRPTERF